MIPNKVYDWIVVGGGLTGSALSYELARQKFSVLLLEQHPQLQGATRHSYGGIAYWSGINEMTQEIGRVALNRYRHLEDELKADLEFRELDLLLTIDADTDPQTILPLYQQFAVAPQYLTRQEAREREPLLNADAIAAALCFPHAHVSPLAVTQAYRQACQRYGGQVKIAQVMGFKTQADRCTGVKTSIGDLTSSQVAICAGGLSRALLRQSAIQVPLYFTQAELIETKPVDLALNSVVMPAASQRLKLETQSSQLESDPIWDEPGHELVPAILDAGAVQFRDRSLRLGQISRVLTDPNSKVDAAASEAQIRQRVGTILPSLAALPGQWHSCLVAFSRDQLPLIGQVGDIEGIYLFSGFSSPFVFVPPLAQRFAEVLVQGSPPTPEGHPDPWIARMNPYRT